MLVFEFEKYVSVTNKTTNYRFRIFRCAVFFIFKSDFYTFDGTSLTVWRHSKNSFKPEKSNEIAYTFTQQETLLNLNNNNIATSLVVVKGSKSISESLYGNLKATSLKDYIYFH